MKKKKEWLYLQRKNPIAPLPGAYNISVVFTDLISKLIKNTTGKEIIGLYKNNIGTFYGSKKNFDLLSEKTLALILENPKFIKNIKKEFLTQSKTYLKFCESLPLNFSKYSNKKLFSLFKKYMFFYQRTYLYGEPLPWLLKDRLPEFLLEYLNSKNKIKNKKTNEELLGILITGSNPSFVLQEDFEFLKLTKIIKKNKAWSILFNKPVLKILKTLESNKKLEKLNFLLNLHTKKWGWIPYDYGVIIWDKKHFINEIKNKIKLTDLEIEKKIKKFLNYKKETTKKQKEIYKSFLIDNYYKSLFEVLKDCSFLLDYKKEVFTKSHIYIKPLLKELASRIGIKYESFCYLLPSEVEKYLLKEKISSSQKKKIDRRPISSVLHCKYKKGCLILKKEESRNFADKILNDTEKKEKKLTQELKGQIASKGVVRGRVRIILDAKKINQFKEGEILVTKMTSPDYTIGLKKAIGIITDEGGITCHAAIISRELGIPCIIGTKIATKILKNKDIVEINANSGIIKI